MMNGTFRLNAVLRWRELQRDESRQSWADACRAEERLRRRAEQLCVEILAQQARRRQALDTGVVVLDAIQAQHGYELSLRQELEALQREGQQVTRQRETRQAALREAEQAVEALERLQASHAARAADSARRRPVRLR